MHREFCKSFPLKICVNSRTNTIYNKTCSMRFLSNILSTIIGLFVFILLLFFLVLIFAGIASSGSHGVSVEKNSVIELDLSKVAHDYGGKFNYKDFDYFNARHDGVFDVLKAIENAKEDSNIKGISILNDESSLGMAQSKAVRDALIHFKTSGKFVYAYANTFNQREYYINSVADQVYLNPVGDMDFKGLSTELMFFKDLQEKSGIKLEVIRHGKYKSAVEPFLENEMSDANREQVSSLLNSVWNNFAADIAKSRKISVEKVNEIASGMLARTPEMAKSQMLVDKVAYEDEYHNAIKKLLKVDADKDYNSIKILDYIESSNGSDIDLGDDVVAVIYAQGEIGSGEGDINTVGELSMRRSLQEAARDKKVKAIVLRIDSPGGSALTSDLIWREIEITKKKKPVVVSMGNVAASGGYYIACNGNRIFAEPTTITGSIGVFGVLPNFTTLSNRVGIHTQQVKTHQNAGGYSPFMPLDPAFEKVTQEGVERIYKTFVSRVSDGRKMSFQAVDSVAQGRVWSGTEAVKIGLVDELGGMDAAVKYAAKLGKTKDYRTRNYPQFERDLGDLLGSLGIPFVKSKADLIKEEIGTEQYEMLQKVTKSGKMKGIQARIPFEIKLD